ncbi:hypothetical protein [Glycomyces xiaoerkulensis]|uniref:hypothetical protein n=1 Tax=Glycomyces xiaoerkulensis TaxID=2038139 RepID=UPI000C269DC3|nr:hypothetical protein [Glycomyces xiaoerkulensis]
MTYPPPGGYDPQQFQPGSQPPQQPSDPYSQGYGNAPPPPPGYGPGQPSPYPQQPPPPNMTPPVGVQPGYPPQPGSPLPPPMPPPKQNSNLGLILGLIIGLVVVLGVAAVLLVPRLLEDDESESGQAADETTGEESEEPEEPSEEPSPEPTEEDDDTGGSGEGLEGWGAPVNSDDYDPNTPEGAGIAWVVAGDSGDNAAMEELMCADPSAALQSDYEFYQDYSPGYEFLIWGMSREVDGRVQVWADWTWDDAEPDEENADVYSVYVAVEEDGQWKLCDIEHL